MGLPCTGDGMENLPTCLFKQQLDSRMETLGIDIFTGRTYEFIGFELLRFYSRRINYKNLSTSSEEC